MYKNEMSVFFCLQASEMLNMDDFLVDESYDGPYLDHDAKITESFIQSMLFQFKKRWCCYLTHHFLLL